MDKRLPKNEEQLKGELSKVMIRNRRADGELEFTKRIVRNIDVELSPEEKNLYDGVTSFVKDQYQAAGGDLNSMLSLVTLQREVCSSRDAVSSRSSTCRRSLLPIRPCGIKSGTSST
ncbi:hypothetical protein HMSSN036_08030 [Paenibacillus macerans]|nr:hypothetical protein HMSSN036_08030 [Paenibacillus macerans]